MLVKLGLVEQRCKAWLEVLNDGATVTDGRTLVRGAIINPYRRAAMADARWGSLMRRGTEMLTDLPGWQWLGTVAAG